MADKGKGTVIVVKKKGGHGGHHGGAWKVAYADFVTAMMAFFLVMWIIVQSKAVKNHVAGYFQDPTTYAAKVAAGVFDGGKGVLASDGKSVQPMVVPPSEQEARAVLTKAGQEILDNLNTTQGLQEISKQIEVELTEEGLRIQLMESSGATFFDLGSAKLSPSGEKAVAAIAKVISPLNMDVAVEGHTDSHAFGSGSYTNWELSSDRANAARRLLEQSGVSPKHIAEVRGYADTRLRYPAVPDDPKNRRISIIVFSKLYDRRSASVDPQKLTPDASGNPPATPAPAAPPHSPQPAGHSPGH